MKRPQRSTESTNDFLTLCFLCFLWQCFLLRRRRSKPKQIALLVVHDYEDRAVWRLDYVAYASFHVDAFFVGHSLTIE